MARVPAPTDLCARVSSRAAQIATEKMKGYGWSNKSIGAILPLPGEGTVGLRTTQKYLMYQEQGIRPFVMWWVDGHTVPLSCNRGDGPHLRKGSGVGQPGYVNIPHRGRVWRDQKWKHPGLRPKNFMRDSLVQAVRELKPELQQQLMRSLTGGRADDRP